MMIRLGGLLLEGKSVGIDFIRSNFGHSAEVLTGFKCTSCGRFYTSSLDIEKYISVPIIAKGIADGLEKESLDDEIDKIMSGDIREAHMRFAKEIIEMYDDITEFESIKERYLQIARGNVPDDIESVNACESEINICDLLIKVGFASTKSEAKRMILGNGVKVNSIVVNDIYQNVTIQNEIIVQFGKNKFKKVIR